MVQGGEVLVQKKSLGWVRLIKEKHPSIKLSIVTNGNVGLEMVDVVEHLFSEVFVSVVGFQSETYKAVMGLNIEKTKTFVEKLLANNNIEVIPKFLITPINIHEVSLFLKWIIELGA
ncbi:hypothetical protein BVX94_00405, partial [bacterium B17]